MKDKFLKLLKLKIRGLKQFYGVNSKKGLEFFEAHKAADVIHRKECEKLLDGLSEEEKSKAEKLLYIQQDTFGIF